MPILWLMKFIMMALKHLFVISVRSIPFSVIKHIASKACLESTLKEEHSVGGNARCLFPVVGEMNRQSSGHV